MNRRSEPRFDVYYRAKIVSLDDPGRQIDAQLTDISGAGMRLVAPRELPEDQLICVEVGQHLVLAEVRNTSPRGSRFLIGAEKIHTLNLLTLPDSMNTQDRIQALVDDYHLRIQFALEADREKGPDAAGTPTRLIASLEDKPPDQPAPASAAPPATVPEPRPSSSPETRATQKTQPIFPPAPPLAIPPAATNFPAVSSPLPPVLPVVEPPIINESKVAARATPVAVEPSQPLEPDPVWAPAMRTDPSPAVPPPVPLNALVEIDFGQLRIILPEVQGMGDEIVPTGTQLPDAERTATEPANRPKRDAKQEHAGQKIGDHVPVLELAAPAGTGPDGASPEPSGSLPTVQPIWMAPPESPQTEVDSPRELDPLRALAIQHDLARDTDPEPRRQTRTIAALAAALVAGLVLIALLFGPIRDRAMLLLPFASASEKAGKTDPGVILPPIQSPHSVTPRPASPPEESTAPPADADSKPATPSTSTTPAVAGQEPVTAPGQAAKSPPTTALPVTPKPAVVTPVPAAVAPPKPAATAPRPVTGSVGSQVHSSTLRTSAPSWVWACADGKTLAGRMLAGGSDMQIEFSRQARVLVGNAGAVAMDLDGKPLGSLGPSGRARVVELNPDGFHLAATLGSQECEK